MFKSNIKTKIMNRNIVSRTKYFLKSKCYQKEIFRRLNVLEHVSFTILKEGGIQVPTFHLAKTPQEAKKFAEELKTRDLVLKAQVLAGGRGVGKFKSGLQGGVQMVSNPEEAEEIAKKMIGQILVTKQTGKAGRICNSVLVTQRMFPRREFYLAVMMERSFGGPVFIASSQGGVSIEDVAKKSPEAIIYVPIDPIKGITHEQACKIADTIGLGGDFAQNTSCVIEKMYDIFVKKDALLVEINPFAEDMHEGDPDKVFYSLDCKCRFDDNAEFRQKELFALRDWTQEDPKEKEASKYGLNYIALDGTIGCMVNGAGLAMATMDIIKLHGGEPANFLDVGGGATAEAVREAFKIITTDPKVLSIMVNIFGGIMRCDIVAKGIIDAAKELKLKVPIVVRLKGTNVEEAKKMIKESKMKIIPADDFAGAASIAVKLSHIIRLAKSANIKVKFQASGEDDGAKSMKKTTTGICGKTKEKDLRA